MKFTSRKIASNNEDSPWPTAGWDLVSKALRKYENHLDKQGYAIGVGARRELERWLEDKVRWESQAILKTSYKEIESFLEKLERS